jgi:3-deoxy-D-manno-octulosonic-acid transferase
MEAKTEAKTASTATAMATATAQAQVEGWKNTARRDEVEKCLAALSARVAENTPCEYLLVPRFPETIEELRARGFHAEVVRFSGHSTMYATHYVNRLKLCVPGAKHTA